MLTGIDDSNRNKIREILVNSKNRHSLYEEAIELTVELDGINGWIGEYSGHGWHYEHRKGRYWEHWPFITAEEFLSWFNPLETEEDVEREIERLDFLL